ncbi:DUF421 domain-containing protein [Roseibium sp.]|uniref:DUF421 domain-containing protein n=1 Tax=Roseibium sp. TaxID=1936156 RepID=UPI003A982779
MSQPIFFDGTDDLLRIVVRTPILYLAIIGFIRIAGKRSMAQMNNFDWIVTVALGSMVASGVLLKDVTVAETLTAVALFLALQYVLTSLTCRSRWFAHVIKASPRELVKDGALVPGALDAERVSQEELDAVVRQEGLQSIAGVESAVLETDASVSVIKRRSTGEAR